MPSQKQIEDSKANRAVKVIPKDLVSEDRKARVLKLYPPGIDAQDAKRRLEPVAKKSRLEAWEFYMRLKDVWMVEWRAVKTRETCDQYYARRLNEYFLYLETIQ